MRQSTLAVSVLAGLLVVAPLLTACGKDAHPGAAAVVDGERISVSHLQAKVEDVRAAQRATPQADQLIQRTGQLGRATLNGMIFERVLERTAREEGVTLDRRAVQEAQKSAEQGAGGIGRLRAMWLQQYAVAPDQVDEQIRNQVLMDRLAQRLGADRSTPEGQEKIMAALRRTSGSMGIEVNPRFGTWSDKDMLLTPARAAWLRQEAAAPHAPHG
ncbi:SurA N-terminal domain-containing protein [Streptomyces sp. URMC 123]|uniref:SurA N-terminal domain-containing protein n=1 Tax=Streptomyces sp. URMC 123 TaxID=3423403 RepID=UPI003F1E30AC